MANGNNNTEQDYNMTPVVSGELGIDLTENEMSFLMDMADNASHNIEVFKQAPCLLWNAQDCKDTYYQKWGLDKAEMLAKLKTLSQADQEQIVNKALEQLGEGVVTDGQVYTSGVSIYGLNNQRAEAPDTVLT